MRCERLLSRTNDYSGGRNGMKRKNRINDFDARLSDDAARLNLYLYRYKDCFRQKKLLERRQQEIRREFSAIKPLKFDAMPRGGQADGDGPAVALMVRLDEIDEKINEQMSRSVKLLSDIMNIIDLLPEDTPEEILSKAIIENRYIDRMGWDRICRENCCSRSKTYRHWRKGLNALLGFRKVRKILKDYYGE